MRWLFVGLLLIAGCTVQQSRFLPDGFRDQSVNITSSTRFDPARFAGDWVVIESFEQSPARGPISEMSFTERPDGYLMREAVADGAARTQAVKIGAFGRLTPGDTSRDPIWVLWVDEDHRTAVLGNPSGRMGRILNRGPHLRADRLQAARDVLAFNGYDLSRLRKVAP